MRFVFCPMLHRARQYGNPWDQSIFTVTVQDEATLSHRVRARFTPRWRSARDDRALRVRFGGKIARAAGPVLSILWRRNQQDGGDAVDRTVQIGSGMLGTSGQPVSSIPCHPHGRWRLQGHDASGHSA